MRVQEGVYLGLLGPSFETPRLDVHQFHGRRLVEHAVGNAFVHHDVRDGGYLVVQAFEMLDVHRGEHVYARTEQLLHVLVALTVATSAEDAMRPATSRSACAPACVASNPKATACPHPARPSNVASGVPPR